MRISSWRHLLIWFGPLIFYHSKWFEGINNKLYFMIFHWRIFPSPDRVVNGRDTTPDPGRPSLVPSTSLLFSCGLGSRYGTNIPVHPSPPRAGAHADLREAHADILTWTQVKNTQMFPPCAFLCVFMQVVNREKTSRCLSKSEQHPLCNNTCSQAHDAFILKSIAVVFVNGLYLLEDNQLNDYW